MKKSTMIIILCIFTIMGCKASITWAESSSKLSQEEIDEFMEKGAQFYAEKEYADAIECYRKAADHGNAWGQNNLAWILATVNDSKLRDGKLAVFYALKATKQEPKNPAFVRTLAAAYARNQEFDKAIETQKNVIELLEENDSFSEEFKEFLKTDHLEKLQFYQKHQAYVDEK